LEDFPQVGGKKIWITTTPSVHVYIWSIFGFSRRYSPSKSPDVWVLLLWKRYKVSDCEFTTNPIPLCFHQVPTYCHIQSHGNHTVFHVCNVTMFRMLKFFGCQKKVPNFGTMWPVWRFFGGWSFWDISSSHIRRLAYKMCIGCSPLREKSDHQDYSICRTPLLTFTFHFCWWPHPKLLSELKQISRFRQDNHAFFAVWGTWSNGKLNFRASSRRYRSWRVGENWEETCFTKKRTSQKWQKMRERYIIYIHHHYM